jgi:hypothetical protein
LRVAVTAFLEIRPTRASPARQRQRQARRVRP